jgi:creatinine amidohydrolase
VNHDIVPRDETAWAYKPASPIREIARRDGSVLVLPVGSIEQHGNHLPVVTDTILASTVASGGAEHAHEEDVPVLVTPPVWSGFSPHHLSFGGTLSVEMDTLVSVLSDVANSAIENGFDAVLLLNGHGGNEPIIDATVTEIGKENPDVEVSGLSYFAFAKSVIDDVRDSDTGGMAHGGEFETSIMLHFFPDLVAEDDQRKGTPLDDPYEQRTKDLFVGGPLSIYRPFKAYSDTGAIGSPELATAEKGEELFDHLSIQLGDLLCDISEEVSS